MSALPVETKQIREILGSLLRRNHFDVVDVIPIPKSTDPKAQRKNLEELLNEFNHVNSNEVSSYFIQVKSPSSQSHDSKITSTLAKRSANAVALDAIYLANGKLNIPYLMKTASILYSSKEYALARNIYKTIAQSGEQTAAALYGMARCFEAEGKLDQAQNDFEESIAYQPSLECYQHLVVLLNRQKKFQESAETIERALLLKDLSNEVRVELHQACGNSWTQAQKYREAEQHYLKSLELNPEANEIRTNLGALYLQAGKPQEAKNCFSEVLRKSPKCTKASFGLGLVHLTEGEKRKAHDCFAKSLDIDINDPVAVYHLVSCAYEIKSYTTATRLVEEYIQVAPVSIQLLYSLAGLQFMLHRNEDARTTLGRILELSPQHMGAKDLLNMIERTAAQ